MCRLLMRRLGARRHGCIAFRPWAGGAIADRKNIVVAGGLQRLSDNELVGLVGFKAVEVVKKRGCLTPAAQTTSSAAIMRPSASLTPFGTTAAPRAEV